MKHRMTAIAVAVISLAAVSAAAIAAERTLLSSPNFKSSTWKKMQGASSDISDRWGTNYVLRMRSVSRASYTIKMPANYRPEQFTYKLSFRMRASNWTKAAELEAAVVGGNETEPVGKVVAAGSSWKNINLSFNGFPAKGQPTVTVYLETPVGIADDHELQVDDLKLIETPKR